MDLIGIEPMTSSMPWILSGPVSPQFLGKTIHAGESIPAAGVRAPRGPQLVKG